VQYTAIIRIVGFMLMLFSTSVIVPLFICFFYQDGEFYGFLITGALEFIIGFLGWFSLRNKKPLLKTRDGFLIVALIWIVLSLFAALPFFISPLMHLSYTNAFFEAVSGLTTTGATIITDIDSLPHAILFYRQELQFLGGMGIVVLAVAVLPMLGIGGMQLYQAEKAGPLRESKLTPRITETAKALWFIYLILTFACALCYWIAGMGFFDAIGESFGTISTGGFSMHNSSFAFYHSNAILIISILFMFLGGTSFALHFTAFQMRNIFTYWKDVEFRYYVSIISIVALFTFAIITGYRVYPTIGTSLIKSLFMVVSMVTTTGFTNEQFGNWPSFIPILLMTVAIIGACSGSTTGGIKVMRFILICKQSMREIRRLIHPNGVYPMKFGSYPLDLKIIEAMWGFIAIFIASFIILLLALMATGMDLITAFSAVVDTLANVGAGLGIISTTFVDVTTAAKWILMLSMIAGRLEIFTLLLLITPVFWRN